jgi:hypothetical protein
MPKLFSYGTLQLENVQIELFGRRLEGTPDTLEKYKVTVVEISDPEVVRKSGQNFHPIIEYSGDQNHQVEGTLFEVTEDEIIKADSYEVDDYKRIEVVFRSNNKGFIYVKK